MTIVALYWQRYRVPFARPFMTAHGPLTMREGAIVEITIAEGSTGIGEIAPLPAFGGEDLASACAALPTLAEHLRGCSLQEALALLTREQLPASTRCGVEMALLDALGKAEGRSLSTLLAPPGFVPRTSIAVNAVVGASSTVDAVAAALSYKDAGYRCLKLKMGVVGAIEAEIERVRAVRVAIGPEMQLRLDANAAWSFEQARAILIGCQPFAIQYVEQPLNTQDLAGMHALRRAVPIPIAADEAVSDLTSARRILASEAADLLIIKLQAVGGLRAGQLIIQEAAAHGVRSVLTTSIESGVTLAATLHLAAALPSITLPCGLATGHLLVDTLLRSALPIRNGVLMVPEGAGLGVGLDRYARTYYQQEVS